MAINDIKISELANIDLSSVTDDSITVLVESGSTFNITMAQIKEFTKFLLTEMPSVPSNALEDTTEIVVQTAEQSKTTLEDLVIYLGKTFNVERASMRLANSRTQNITDDVDPVVINAFDTQVTETSNFVVDPVTSSISYTGPGASSAIVTVGLNLDFPGTEEAELYFYVNDVEYSSVPLHVQGRGVNKPVAIYWSSDISLNSNDKLDIRARNADTGSFTLTYLRSTFRVDINSI